ncbi:MAG: recombination protein RecR [Myxococcales bacterium]|nr:recombination protein RecR [Myxococcales bacterium]
MSDISLPPALDRLARLLGRLPGVGERSAHRLALFVLGQEPDYAHALGVSLAELHDLVRFCRDCHHFAEGQRCVICADPRRDCALLCVVEDVPDLLAIERCAEYRGLYHVLGGALSPLRGVGPRELTFDHLIARLDVLQPEELIVATSISVEGEATASYLQNLLRGRAVRLTRIASGVPQGTDLEYLDQATLGRALRARLPFGRG